MARVVSPIADSINVGDVVTLKSGKYVTDDGGNLIQLKRNTDVIVETMRRFTEKNGDVGSVIGVRELNVGEYSASAPLWSAIAVSGLSEDNFIHSDIAHVETRTKAYVK